MAAGAQPAPDLYSSKDIELVRKLAEKTRANRIAWKRSETGFSASVSGQLEIGFVRAWSAFGPPGWSLFTVRDKRGNEILRVDNPLGLRSLLQGHSEEMIRQSVNELYQAAERSSAAAIDKAIQWIDRV